jgi:quercetin dioxygenase-like cupin family protein
MELWQLDTEPVALHAPRVLRSDDDANRVILLALPEGERLDDHQVHEHALVVVLNGRLLVRAGDDEHELAAPGLVYFEPAERHEVTAVADSRILICLAPWPGVGHPSRPTIA